MYFIPRRSEQWRYIEEHEVISKYTVLDLTFNYEQKFSLTSQYVGNTEMDPICQ